jgi:hypothetical protein
MKWDATEEENREVKTHKEKTSDRKIRLWEVVGEMTRSVAVDVDVVAVVGCETFAAAAAVVAANSEIARCA